MNLLPLFIFWCLWFLNFSTRTSFAPLLPLIEDSLSLTHGETGGLFTTYGIGYSLSLLIAGRFAPAWGYKRVVVAGFIGIGLIFFYLQWVESYPALHILFFLLGFSSGSYLPSILSIITETYESRHWGRAIGIHDSAASLSIFSIPILVTIGLHFFSWRRLLLFLGFACLVLPIFFWKVSKEPQHMASGKGPSYLDLLKVKTTWIIATLWTCAAASNLGVYSILPLYLIKERGIDFGLANTLLGISRVAGIVVSVLAGFLTDRYGYRRMLKWSIATSGLSTISLALASGLSLILISLTLQATLSLAFFPVGFATISKLTPPSERALTVAIIASIGVVFGTGTAPFVLGVIADHSSFQVGIFCLGVLATLSSLSVRLLSETVEEKR